MKGKSVVNRILSYVERNLEKDLTLEEIAKELHYSKFYVERVFKEHTGQPLYRYMKNRRLNEAAKKLIETRRPIVEIALEAGYHSQQAFTQAFHEVSGLSPQKYRKLENFVPIQTRIDLSAIRAYGISRLRHMDGRMAA
ncbi:MAG: helix-turn-helix transcriptional regulator [Lachnospiraceae bacterium]|nr:helix-turn-helix transcriptional regulator [Lachnospiraceae bacterium]